MSNSLLKLIGLVIRLLEYIHISFSSSLVVVILEDTLTSGGLAGTGKAIGGEPSGRAALIVRRRLIATENAGSATKPVGPRVDGIKGKDVRKFEGVTLNVDKGFILRDHMGSSVSNFGHAACKRALALEILSNIILRFDPAFNPVI
jgi:hypothetical protein